MSPKKQQPKKDAVEVLVKKHIEQHPTVDVKQQCIIAVSYVDHTSVFTASCTESLESVMASDSFLNFLQSEFGSAIPIKSLKMNLEPQVPKTMTVREWISHALRVNATPLILLERKDPQTKSLGIELFESREAYRNLMIEVEASAPVAQKKDTAKVKVCSGCESVKADNVGLKKRLEFVEADNVGLKKRLELVEDDNVELHGQLKTMQGTLDTVVKKLKENVHLSNHYHLRTLIECYRDKLLKRYENEVNQIESDNFTWSRFIDHLLQLKLNPDALLDADVLNLARGGYKSEYSRPSKSVHKLDLDKILDAVEALSLDSTRRESYYKLYAIVTNPLFVDQGLAPLNLDTQGVVESDGERNEQSKEKDSA